MLIRTRKPWMLTDNDVTSEAAYHSRREIMAAGAMGLAATAALPACARADDEDAEGALSYVESDYTVDDEETVYAAVTGYNNFYEFGTGKSDPARYAHNMITDPWSIEVGGECMKPATVGVEDLVDFSALEERIYRHRCVEAWSMVIPWVGVPLSSVLAKFEPTNNAKYVAFETLANPEQMRGVRGRVLDWPYVEGLRMDEAMHPLTLMVVGLYGKVLPNQNGAPLRIHVPWKYGFKSAKSLVKITFVEEQPPTSWNISAPNEYGFYSNVNPNVRHPRWSQAHEDFIIDQRHQPRRDTVMFNGYGDEVAHLYDGMDLRANF